MLVDADALFIIATKILIIYITHIRGSVGRERGRKAAYA
jgi:hypothetical protein